MSTVCMGATVIPAVPAGTSTWVSPAPGTTRDQQMVGPGPGLDRPFDPVQHHLVPFDPDIEVDAAERVVRTWLAQAPGRHGRRPGTADVADARTC